MKHPLETPVETITYQGVEFEVVQRPDVIWAGCVEYARNNTAEPNSDKAFKRLMKLKKKTPYSQLTNAGWSAAISINFRNKDKPSGMMFAQECATTEKQDKRYDIMTQPGGLWLRVRNDEAAATALGICDSAESFNAFHHCHMYFAGEQAPLIRAAAEHGYALNPDVHIEIEYHCHAEYDMPPHTSYAYIPIVRN